MTKIEELIIEKACEEERKKTFSPLVSKAKGVHSAYGIGFVEGAEWMSKQNSWRNFKDECPKKNSRILRRVRNSKDCLDALHDTYYADFWSEDRPDKWEQKNDVYVYEWQYINE